MDHMLGVTAGCMLGAAGQQVLCNAYCCSAAAASRYRPGLELGICQRPADLHWACLAAWGPTNPEGHTWPCLQGHCVS